MVVVGWGGVGWGGLRGLPCACAFMFDELLICGRIALIRDAGSALLLSEFALPASFRFFGAFAQRLAPFTFT